MSRISLLTGSILLALAVTIGAFGAHGLKSLVTPQMMEIFETGVRYHFYHGFALLILGLYSHQFPTHKIHLPFYAFSVGTLLFSFNCYVYVLTHLKPLAMMMPIGGFLFILGWSSFAWRILKSGETKATL